MEGKEAWLDDTQPSDLAAATSLARSINSTVRRCTCRYLNRSDGQDRPGAPFSSLQRIGSSSSQVNESHPQEDSKFERMSMGHYNQFLENHLGGGLNIHVNFESLYHIK